MLVIRLALISVGLSTLSLAKDPNDPSGITTPTRRNSIVASQSVPVPPQGNGQLPTSGRTSPISPTGPTSSSNLPTRSPSKTGSNPRGSGPTSGVPTNGSPTPLRKNSLGGQPRPGPLIVDMPMEKERKLTPQEAESILAHIKKFPPSIDTSAKAASPPASPKKSPINGGASRPPRRTDQGSGTPGAPPSPSLGRSTTLGKLGKRAFDLKAISDETVPILVKRVFTPTPDWVLIGYHGTTAQQAAAWNAADGVITPRNQQGQAGVGARLGFGFYVASWYQIARSFANRFGPYYPGRVCEVYVHATNIGNLRLVEIADWFVDSPTEVRTAQLDQYLQSVSGGINIGEIVRFAHYFNGGQYGQSFGWQMLIPDATLQRHPDVVRVRCEEAPPDASKLSGTENWRGLGGVIKMDPNKVTQAGGQAYSWGPYQPQQ